MSEQPIYSDLDEIQESGRLSFADAPETTGGVDDFRRSFGEMTSSRSLGAFGRSPEEEAKRAASLEQEPIDFAHINATIAENMALRERIGVAEWEAENAREDELETLAYMGDYESSAEFEAVADELLNHEGASERFESILSDWHEKDAAGADTYLQARQRELEIQQAAESIRAEQNAQSEHLAAYARELADFYSQHPEYRAGTAKNELLAGNLAQIPNIGESPESFRQGIEYAHEASEDAAQAVARTAGVENFRAAFRDELLRHAPMSHNDTERAERAARFSSPQSIDAVLGDIAGRTKGTKAQRQAALQKRDAELHEAFAQAARGSGFGEGAREQAARAKKAHAEDLDRRNGRRRPGAF